MRFGHLINVKSASSDGQFTMIGYVVAEANAAVAVEIVEGRLAELTDKVVEVCRVSGQLLKLLRVPAGGFVRLDGRPIPNNSSGARQ